MRSRQLIGSVLAAVLVAVMVSACESPSKPPRGVPSDPLAAEDYPRITAEGDLAKYLRHSTPTTIRMAGQPLRVSVPVRLVNKDEFNVQYRFEFFDAAAQPLQTEPQWKYERLPARTQVFLEGAAMDNTAQSWRLIVRPAR